MDRKTERGIQEVEEEVFKRASVSSTRSQQENEDGSQYIKLCSWRGIVYEM